MRKFFLSGVFLAVSISAAVAATPGALLEQHLKPGAEMFDASGRTIGIVQELELDGSVIVREARVPARIPSTLYVAEDGEQAVVPEGAVLKVVPPGSVVWTGYGLKVNLSAAAISQLPTPG